MYILFTVLALAAGCQSIPQVTQEVEQTATDTDSKVESSIETFQKETALDITTTGQNKDDTKTAPASMQDK